MKRDNPVRARRKRLPSSRRTAPWGELAASVVGGKHLAQGRPNQDAVLTASRLGGSVIAVADGHSMAACCRADRGSRFAVEIAVKEGLAWLERLNRHANPSISAAVDLSEAIHAQWVRRVRADIGQNPFTADEREALGKALAMPSVAYGATLIVAVATDRICLGMQIGDGQLFAVTAGGIAGQLIVPAEAEGDASDSLCQLDAFDRFRYALVSLEETPLAAIVCSTDGYDKAFRSVEDFLQVGGLIIQSLKEAGPAEIAASLPAALREASDQGSWDDASCAILYRQETLRHGRSR